MAAAALRCAARQLVLGGSGIQRAPAVAAEQGQRRLPPRFVHNGPSPSSRLFFSYQRGEADRPLTFEEKVALWKRCGNLLFRTTNAVSMIVASFYILKLSVHVAVNELREHGYVVREAASLIKRSEDKLRSLRDR